MTVGLANYYPGAFVLTTLDLAVMAGCTVTQNQNWERQRPADHSTPEVEAPVWCGIFMS
jgi:hypothetical protein